MHLNIMGPFSSNYPYINGLYLCPHNMGKVENVVTRSKLSGSIPSAKMKKAIEYNMFNRLSF